MIERKIGNSIFNKKPNFQHNFFNNFLLLLSASNLQFQVKILIFISLYNTYIFNNKNNKRKLLKKKTEK